MLSDSFLQQGRQVFQTERDSYYTQREFWWTLLDLCQFRERRVVMAFDQVARITTIHQVIPRMRAHFVEIVGILS